MIEVFDVPKGGRTAVDMAKVEAIMEGDGGTVTVVTHNDTYRVKRDFDDAVKLWRKALEEAAAK